MKTTLHILLFMFVAAFAQNSDTDSADAIDTITDGVDDTTVQLNTGGMTTNSRVKNENRDGLLTECPEDMEYIISRQKRRVREFCIDRYEYPNKKGEKPMADITWYMAKQMCERAGKRLCMDWEWEDACAGLNKWDYAYHNVYDETKCNTAGSEPVKSGDFSECKTKNYELYDMVGNLREWTAGGGVGAAGGIYKDKRGARCSRWDALSLQTKDSNTGFRCCINVNTGRFGKVKR